MRKNYRKIWEDYHNKEIPEGYEIHHIDGNRDNNSIENLACVSIEEHLQIHRDQKDWGAVQAILIRMENTDDIKGDIKKAASEFQKQLLEKGEHNFQKIDPERRSEISKDIHKNRETAFLGIEDRKENARKAGLKAAEKKAGFLNTDSENHGSKHIKGTKWWNNGQINKRSVSCPGEGFTEGFLCKIVKK